MTVTVQTRARHPALIAGSVMLASLLYSIDWTIAAVALPHMQGTFSATQDQVSWVITSYIVASAIMIPTANWLSSRFGRRRLFLCAVTGFTGASVLCGAANSLTMEVLARIVQGMSGAFIIPLSHAIILDTYPPEQHGKAMALWGAGWVFGSVIGPTVGGYLTEYFIWRDIFYINVPFGLLALVGGLTFVPETQRDPGRRLDWFGFLTLAVGIGALQMMLDRGQRLDWFDSEEIIVLACLAVLGLYLFAMHSLTAPDPFLDPRLIARRSFFVSLLLISVYGLITLPPMVLMPAFLEHLRGFSIDAVGLLQSPRGAGLLVALIVGGHITGKIDPRTLIALGLGCLAVSSWEMSGWTAEVGEWPIVWTGFLQGIGAGVLLVPIQVIAFQTLAPHQRTEAASVFNLVRSVFSSSGVSLALTLFVVTSTTGRARLVEYVSLYSRGLHYPSGFHTGTEHGLAVIEHEIELQAAMMGYNAVFLALAVAAFAALPLVLLIGRRVKTAGPASPDHQEKLVIGE
ncbi:MAG TPA: DHA2 family efflux MFS transporter permease subunit [Burkholderiales bacterium]|nr:DHA2 family efflux MFS transporter permease subunit [Burkholderiales bacterium]